MTNHANQQGLICRLSRLLPVVALAVAGLAHAQAWPTKPVRIVVPVGAGGTTDLLARLVGQALSQSTGQPFVVDLKPGGAGTIGSLEVARAQADGHTLLVGTTSTHGINPAVTPNIQYNALDDFTPIALLAEANTVMLVSPKLNVRTFKELIELARSKPNTINYTSTGAGTYSHMMSEMLRLQTGMLMTHVPYKGAGQMLPDLMSGIVHLSWDALPSGLPHVKDGKLRGIVVSGPRRSAAAPDLPTLGEAMAEMGLPRIAVNSWFGLYAPRGLSPELARRINEEVNKVLNTPDMAVRFAGYGIEPGKGSAADFAALTRSDIERWRRVAREANVKVE